MPAFPPEPSPTHPTSCCQHTFVYKKITRFCWAHHLWTSLYILLETVTQAKYFPATGVSYRFNRFRLMSCEYVRSSALRIKLSSERAAVLCNIEHHRGGRNTVPLAGGALGAQCSDQSSLRRRNLSGKSFFSETSAKLFFLSVSALQLQALRAKKHRSRNIACHRVKCSMKMASIAG